MISHVIDSGLLVIKAEGNYTSQDIRAVFAAALSDPQLPPTPRLLVDARYSLSNPSLSDIETRLAILKGLQPSVAPVCAFVVSSELHYGVGRMYQSLSEMQQGPRIQIFRDIDAAKKWLLSQAAVYLLALLIDVATWLSAAA